MILQKARGGGSTSRLIPPKDKISKEVFKLWIDHGVSPNNESYEYIVRPPNTTLDELKKGKVINLLMLGEYHCQHSLFAGGLKTAKSISFRPFFIVQDKRSLRSVMNLPFKLLPLVF